MTGFPQIESDLIIILNVDGYGKQTFSIHLILDSKRNNFQAYYHYLDQLQE